MMERTRPEACPSDLTLDALRAGELDPQAVEQTELHVAQCSSCRVRQAEHEQAHSQFLKAAPTLEALRLRAHAQEAPSRPDVAASLSKVWAMRAIGAFAMCAFALLMFRPSADEPTTRSKGGPHLGLFIKHAERVTRGQSGALVQPDDLLRFTYSSGRDTYLALLNVDAQGTTVYYPTAGTRAPRVRAGSDIALDFSIQLDDQPGTERVLGVFCQASFDIPPLVAALKSSGKLPDDMGCHIDELQLRKLAAP